MTEIYGLNDSYFTLYMKDGKRLLQKERSLSKAISALNVNAGDVEWSDTGSTDTHYWCEKTKVWIRRLPK